MAIQVPQGLLTNNPVTVFPLDKLPIPVRDGYNQRYQNDFGRIRMDDGQYRLYRDVESQPEKVALTWRLSWDQMAMFDAWVEYDLNGGVAWFDLALSPVMPIYSYKFLTSPVNSYDAGQGEWRVTVEAFRIIPGPPVRPLGYFPTWPTNLPEPEKSNYSYTVPDHVTFGNIKGGDAGSRRRFVTRLTSYKAKWFLTHSQYEAFQAFVNDELASGLAHFKAPFANGIGYGLVKGRFITPPAYTPAGACWEVTAQLETSEAPIMSRLVYELGGKMSFNDFISFSEELLVYKTGLGYINDTIVLTDEIARLLRDADTLGLSESLRIKTKRDVAELLELSDQLRLTLRTKITDQVTLNEALVWAYTKNLQDSVQLLETISRKSQFKRATSDEIAVASESLDFDILFNRPVDDLIVVSDTGQACWQNYAEPSYFAEDYVYTCYSWSDQNELIELSESVKFDHSKGLIDDFEVAQELLDFVIGKGIAESVELGEILTPKLRIIRRPTDEFGFATDGSARMQDYAEPSYFDSADYVGTYIPFLN